MASNKTSRSEGAAENLKRLITNYSGELDDGQVTMSVLAFINDIENRLGNLEEKNTADDDQQRQVMTLLWGDTRLNFDGIGVQVQAMRAQMTDMINQQNATNTRLDGMVAREQERVERWDAQMRWNKWLGTVAVAHSILLLFIVATLVWIASGGGQ